MTSNNTIKLPLYDGQPPLRQSSLTTMERCPRRWTLSVLCGIRPVKRSPAMDRGSYMHHAMGVAMQGVRDGLPLPQIRRAMAVEVEARHSQIVAEMETYYAPHPPPDDLTKKAYLTARKGLACAARLFREYHALITRVELAVLGTEIDLPKTITLPPPIGSVDHGGRLDVAFVKGTNVYLTDWKSIDGSPNEHNLLYPWKMQPYLNWMAVEHMIREGMPPFTTAMKVRGFHHGVVRVPGIILKGVGTPKQQTVASYMEECDEWWDGAGKWAKNAPKWRDDPPVRVHKVEMTPRLRAAGLLRVADYLDKVEDATRVLSMKKGWGVEDVVERVVMSESGCLSKMGNCPFNHLCLDTSRSIPQILDTHYVQSADPLDSDPNRYPDAGEGDDD